MCAKKDFLELTVRIVECMQKANKPLILQHIAKYSKLTPQLTSYHISQMIEWGIAIKLENDENKTYFILQPAYYDKGWLESLFALMTPYLEAIINQIDLSQIKVTYAQAVTRNFIVFLRLFEKRVEALAEKSYDKEKKIKPPNFYDKKD